MWRGFDRLQREGALPPSRWRSAGSSGGHIRSSWMAFCRCTARSARDISSPLAELLIWSRVSAPPLAVAAVAEPWVPSRFRGGAWSKVCPPSRSCRSGRRGAHPKPHQVGYRSAGGSGSAFGEGISAIGRTAMGVGEAALRRLWGGAESLRRIGRLAQGEKDRAPASSFSHRDQACSCMLHPSTGCGLGRRRLPPPRCAFSAPGPPRSCSAEACGDARCKWRSADVRGSF